MRYILFSLLILTGCGVCDDSAYYQINMKDETSTGCRYRADGMGFCATWQKTEQVFFTDSCRRFSLSQVVSREVIDSYRGKNNSVIP